MKGCDKLQELINKFSEVEKSITSLYFSLDYKEYIDDIDILKSKIEELGLAIYDLYNGGDEN